MLRIPRLVLVIAVLVIDDPFVPQLFEELADVGANFGRVGIAELGLQF